MYGKNNVVYVSIYDSDNDKWNFNLPGSTSYTDDILDKYDFRIIEVDWSRAKFSKWLRYFLWYKMRKICIIRL